MWCGSREGNKPFYSQQMKELGRLIGEHGYDMVYGGGTCGLMRVAADAALDSGALVTGVYPKNFLATELPYSAVTIVEAESMADRKNIMIELADCIVIGPGGLGTLDELSEIWTLLILCYTKKPFVILNVDGYFNPFFVLIDHMVAEGFLQAGDRQHLHTVDTPREAFDLIPQLIARAAR